MRQFKPGQLQSGSLYPITASFALTASYTLGLDTGSLTTTASFNAFTASYTTGSFTGSFKGDGSQLTGIVSSKWTGSNPISRQSDVEITGSLRVQGNITGSLFGTASWATNAVTASYVQTAQTASYVLNAISSSYALQAVSASYASNSLSSSFATTASYVTPLYQQIILSGSLKLDPTQDPDPTGIDLDSTVLFQSSSNTTLGYDLYVRQNGNLVKWKWVEGTLETGLLYGGVVTYSGSNVFVSPGSGIIAEHNATTGSEISPMIEYVTWNAITQSITNITTQQVTYLYIDQNGSLQQQSTRFTSQQYHDYIPLGAVGHFDYTQVSAFGGSVQTAYDQVSQIINFIDAFGPLKMSGYGLTGQPSSLRLSVGSGISYIHGGFYENDPEFPSQITTPSQATASLAYVFRSGSSVIFDTNGGALYTTVDPTQYDRDGDGTLATVGNGNWSIQRVFTDPKTGVLYVYYGQARYTTLLNALQYLPTDPFTEGDTFDFTTFVGYLVLRGNASDLTDTSNNSIINGGLFRGSGQGSGGGIAISNLDDLTDVSIVSPTNGEALIYNAGIWQNGNPTSASFAQTASYVLQAVSASFATSASRAVSSSFATTASFASTASFVATAQTASYVLNAVSASTATTASFASTATTASHALEANTVLPLGGNKLSGFISYVISTGSMQYVRAHHTLNIDIPIGGATSTVNLTGSLVATSITSSLQGTASFANTSTSASYAVTASYLDNYVPPFPYTGSAIIIGSLTVIDENQIESINTDVGLLRDINGQAALEWKNRRYLRDNLEQVVVDWDATQLLDTNSGILSVSWNDRVLYDQNGTDRLAWSYDDRAAAIDMFAYSRNYIDLTGTAETLANQPQYGKYLPTGETLQGVTFDAAVVDFNLVYLDTDNTWYPVDASTSSATRMLGIAYNVASDNHVLLEGTVVVNDNALTDSPQVTSIQTGTPIYINTSTAGIFMSTTVPSNAGDHVRLLGYAYYQSVGDSQYWLMKFKPSNDWYVI